MLGVLHKNRGLWAPLGSEKSMVESVTCTCCTRFSRGSSGGMRRPRRRRRSIRGRRCCRWERDDADDKQDEPRCDRRRQGRRTRRGQRRPWPRRRCATRFYRRTPWRGRSARGEGQSREGWTRREDSASKAGWLPSVLPQRTSSSSSSSSSDNGQSHAANKKTFHIVIWRDRPPGHILLEKENSPEIQNNTKNTLESNQLELTRTPDPSIQPTLVGGATDREWSLDLGGRWPSGRLTGGRWRGHLTRGQTRKIQLATLRFIMPPTVGKGQISVAFVRPSVRHGPSVRLFVCPSVAYVANNTRTQRPSVPKFGMRSPSMRLVYQFQGQTVKSQGCRRAGAYRVGRVHEVLFVSLSVALSLGKASR